MEILIKEEYDKIEKFLHNAQVRDSSLFLVNFFFNVFNQMNMIFIILQSSFFSSSSRLNTLLLDLIIEGNFVSRI